MKPLEDLQANLKDSFLVETGNEHYSISGNVKFWIKQHCETYTDEHYHIVCGIMGSVPYPYQPKDRAKVLAGLKTYVSGTFTDIMA